MKFNLNFRVYLNHLKNPEEAVRLVREFKSRDGAKLVARYICIICILYSANHLWSFNTSFFQNLGDISSALKFLVLSGCLGDAFQMAEVHTLFVIMFNACHIKYMLFRLTTTWMIMRR